MTASCHLQLFLSSLRGNIEDPAAKSMEAARRSFNHAIVVLLEFILLQRWSSFLPSCYHGGGY
jgi:hypothetical protein